MRTFAIIVSDARLFARIIRKDNTDIVVTWTVDEPLTPSCVPAWNPHATVHRDGNQHSKSYKRQLIKKVVPKPNASFQGCVQLEVTNADRMLSPSLPLTNPQKFDDVFKIPVNMVTGRTNQYISVCIVSPNTQPLRLSGEENVLLEHTFKDAVPWIIVSFFEVVKSEMRP